MSDARADRLARVRRQLIGAMAKHLPPSAAGLRLLDVDGTTGDVLLEARPDLIITVVARADLESAASNAFDAVTAFDVPLSPSFLEAARLLLRPGGRLITIDSQLDPDESAVRALEDAGYTRILVEAGAECPLPLGRLARGEQPHQTDDTLARVAATAARDLRAALESFNGRAVHLLIQQTPNLPPWKLPPGTVIAWEAAAQRAEDGAAALLAFSSLPAAVSFMQTAVVAGTVRDVSKVVKFRKETARGWALPVLLNPAPDEIDAARITWLPIDPADADTPDE
jgi:hypothetical protein